MDIYHERPEPTAERALRIAAAAIAALLFLLLLEAAPRAHAAEGDAGAEGQEPGAPTLKLSGPGGVDTSAVMLDTRLELAVSGLLARGTLTQRFRNDSAEWREAEYLLPLPQDAAVTRLELQIGERRIVGEIREREEARQVFDAARRAGKRSALLEQQRPHLFTSRVANVPPGQEVAVRVEMLLPVRFRDGEFSLRFPTTQTAIYVPGNPLPQPASADAEPGSTLLSLNGSGWAAETTVVTDAPLITPPQHPRDGSDAQPLNPIELQVDLRPGMPLAAVDALYHDLAIERRGDDFTLAFRDGRAEMDRDLVLRWRPRPSASPLAAVFRERFEGEDYALVMLVPPTAAQAADSLARELVLVIDVSGSMQGEPIRQARRSVLHALNALRPDDYVNVIAFSSGYRALFPEAQRADARTLAAARAFVSGLDANGGTEMRPALEAALRSPAPARTEVAPLRQLIFLTDGAVGNEAELLALIESEGGDARLFTVGIGSAPNGYFMHRAAEVGRGEALFIAQPVEVAPKLDGLFGRIRAPQVRDIAVQWPTAAESYPADIPDLYAGQPILQLARLDSDPGEGSFGEGKFGEASAGTIRVSGHLVDRTWVRELLLPAASNDAGVAVYWARRKLDAILGELRRGVAREAVRAEALPLALRFSLASPFTSFVAVEERPVRPAEAALHGSLVPNVRPQGQAPQTFAFAQGATTGPAKLFLGTLLAFIALIGFTMNRREPLA